MYVLGRKPHRSCVRLEKAPPLTAGATRRAFFGVFPVPFHPIRDSSISNMQFSLWRVNPFFTMSAQTGMRVASVWKTDCVLISLDVNSLVYAR